MSAEQQTYNALGAAGAVQWRQPATVLGINTSTVQQQQLSDLRFTTERRRMQSTPLLNVLHNSSSINQSINLYA